MLRVAKLPRATMRQRAAYTLLVVSDGCNLPRLRNPGQALTERSSLPTAIQKDAAIIRECIGLGEHAPLWSAQLVSIQRCEEAATARQIGPH
jgi:hypothetical protein